MHMRAHFISFTKGFFKKIIFIVKINVILLKIYRSESVRYLSFDLPILKRYKHIHTKRLFLRHICMLRYMHKHHSHKVQFNLKILYKYIYSWRFHRSPFTILLCVYQIFKFLWHFNWPVSSFSLLSEFALFAFLFVSLFSIFFITLFQRGHSLRIA